MNLEKSFVMKSFEEKEDQKIFTFYATVEKRDRDNDLIFVDGIDTTNYDINPVFLDGHDMSKLPIGKVIAHRIVEIEGVKALEIDVIFAPTEDAQKIMKLYEDGFLNMVSIRFIPKDFKYNESLQGYDIFTSELLEVSAVTIPANQYAMLKKSFDDSYEKLTAKIDELSKSLIALQGKIIKGFDSPKTEDDSLYKGLLSVAKTIKKGE